MNVFAKIFAQIFDSSIAADYVVRHIFMDLIVLADRDGVVDMTPDAIARRTNVPKKMILHAIKELMKPDGDSRSHEESGKRLVPLDSHREWGWQIVNFEHYRAIRDEESRRAYFRDKKREYRSRNGKSTSVLDSPTLSTQEEADTEAIHPPTPRKRGMRIRPAKLPSNPGASNQRDLDEVERRKIWDSMGAKFKKENPWTEA
jgi:hypothetical protein